MKDKEEALTIYNFSHPLLNTEVLALEGDKFSKALSFSLKFVNDLESAKVVVWDGIITPKNQGHVTKLFETVKNGKVLLLLGESKTLFKDHPIVKSSDLSSDRTVELFGWNTLPEELLAAFEQCKEKLTHA